MQQNRAKIIAEIGTFESTAQFFLILPLWE